MEEAIFLTRFASHVTVVHRRDTLRASKIMQDKAFANPKISFEWNTEVEEINDTRQGGSHRRWCCVNSVTGERKEIAVDGVFVAIGHTPNTALFAGQLDTDANGYIITHSGSRTSVPGVFACGDVQDHHLPPGDHRRRLGLHGGDRRGEVPGRPSAASRRDARDGLSAPLLNRRVRRPGVSDLLISCTSCKTLRLINRSSRHRARRRRRRRRPPGPA